MTDKPHGAPIFRAPTSADFRTSLSKGWRDFTTNPLTGLTFASIYVISGLVMTWITYMTGHTFWLILAVLGFPLLGALAASGFYAVSGADTPPTLPTLIRGVWVTKNGQLPSLATIIVVIFLFWFFLGHMIFALFLGLSPMTNISSSLSVFWTGQGMLMIAVGTGVGAMFATLVFALSVFGMPMIIDRDVDFMTALLTSITQVMNHPVPYLLWGALIGVVTVASMVPLFLGLFIAMPVLGHASWHLYKAVTDQPQL